jgi:NADH-quinone oxidoreductase subunit M
MYGAIIQMISNGLMTALFFALIGMIYCRTHTRNIHEMGGLLKVVPFLSAAYIIAGLASLGLPGLSGFVAEMTIFVGAFQHQDIFHRVATIMVCTSIVVTAVYILRVIGILLLGEVREKEYHSFKDALWYERLSILALLIPIFSIGLYPLWLSNTIMNSLGHIVQRLTIIL